MYTKAPVHKDTRPGYSNPLSACGTPALAAYPTSPQTVPLTLALLASGFGMVCLDAGHVRVAGGNEEGGGGCGFVQMGVLMYLKLM